uniref:Uncharacterized protein n=1 Tax=Anopheles quadriannulatus TaxID=34691 RepID=A0A182XTA5_ANOQN
MPKKKLQSNFHTISETFRIAFPGMLTAVGCKREPDSEQGSGEEVQLIGERWSMRR